MSPTIVLFRIVAVPALPSPSSAVSRRALLLLLALTIVWGTNWPLFSYAVREVSVWTFRAVSMTGAGLLLLLIARLRGEALAIPRQSWGVLAVSTFFYLILWNVTSTYTAILIPSGQAAVLGFTMPLWSALITWLVLGERLSARLMLAITQKVSADAAAAPSHDSFFAMANAKLAGARKAAAAAQPAA